MKKSVIMTIAVVYILAIVAVSFLGMKMFIYDAEVPVEEIICKSSDKVSSQPYEYVKSTVDPAFDGEIKIKFDQKLKNEVVIDCYVKPDNASNKKVSYHWNANEQEKYKIKIEEKDGCLYVTFTEKGSIIITAYANDDSKKELKIKVSTKLSRDDI